MRPTAKRGRYTSRTNAVARTAAQMLLLKPTVWKKLNVKVHGTERLENVDGPVVVFANHSSHFDAPLIFGSLPRKISRYLATGAAADYFFTTKWKAFLTSLFFNSFPVERPGKQPQPKTADEDPADIGKTKKRLLKKDQKKKNVSRRGLASSLLSDGVPMLIFPEGGRSRTGAIGPFKPGTAALSVSHGVPAIPVAIVGAWAAWPPTQKGLPKGRPEVHVVFGNPMRPLPGEIAHEFNERMRREVIRLHDSTARAYGLKTLDEYERIAAIEQSKKQSNVKKEDVD